MRGWTDRLIRGQFGPIKQSAPAQGCAPVCRELPTSCLSRRSPAHCLLACHRSVLEQTQSTSASQKANSSPEPRCKAGQGFRTGCPMRAAPATRQPSCTTQLPQPNSARSRRSQLTCTQPTTSLNAPTLSPRFPPGRTPSSTPPPARSHHHPGQPLPPTPGPARSQTRARRRHSSRASRRRRRRTRMLE